MSINKKLTDYEQRLERCLYVHRQLILLAEKGTTGQVILHYKNGHLLKIETTTKRDIKLEP